MGWASDQHSKIPPPPPPSNFDKLVKRVEVLENKLKATTALIKLLRGEVKRLREVENGNTN